MSIVRRYALPTLALWAAASPAALADTEVWSWVEARVPLSAEAPITGQPVALRLFSDSRYGLRYPGLGWQFWRVGPLWSVAPGLMVGTHFTTIGVQTAPGAFMQEYRAELEPNFFGRWGDFAWNDRNRLEYRWRWNDQHFRYRNQLRVSCAPSGARWIPFAWEEAMIELNAEGFAQNRAELGVGYQLTDAARLDLGVMVRSRAAAAGWEHDVVFNTYLYFAPDVAPLLGGPRGE